jgi:hypothetical protein
LFFFPGKCDSLLCKEGKGLDDSRVIADKVMVEVGEA